MFDSIKSYFALGAVILVLLATSYLSVRVDRALRPDPNAAPPDTVYKDYAVPRVVEVRDTVREVEPRTITKYETVRDTVVRSLVTPTDMPVRGVLPTNYFSLDKASASVTYFDSDAQQYRTETFDIRPLSNTIAFGVGGFGTTKGGTIFPYLRYEAGRFNLRAGYGPQITPNGYNLTPTVQVNLDLLRYRWR